MWFPYIISVIYNPDSEGENLFQEDSKERNKHRSDSIGKTIAMTLERW